MLGCSAEYAPPAPQHSPSSSSSTSSDVRREHRAHVLVGVLHVAQVARVLDGDQYGERRRRPRAAVEPRRQPLVHVEDARRERTRRRWCRAGGRSPSARRRSRPSRRGSARRRASTRIDAAASAARRRGARRGRAARRSSRRPCRAARRRHRSRLEHRERGARARGRCHASITQPVNSHTSVPVARAALGAAAAAGRPKRGDAPRHEVERAAPAASAGEPASSSRWWPSDVGSRALPPRR